MPMTRKARGKSGEITRKRKQVSRVDRAGIDLNLSADSFGNRRDFEYASCYRDTETY